MKRPLLLIGPAIALLGSLGLALFANSIVGVFDILTFRIVDPPEPPPASLAGLSWAVVSLIALVVGVIVTCIAIAVPDDRLTINALGRSLYVGAGVLLILGAISSAWSVLGVRAGFDVIAAASAAPTAAHVEDMIQSGETPMMIGGVVIFVSAILLLTAGFIRVEKKHSQSRNPAMLSIVVGVASVLVGIVTSLFLLFVWLNGSAVETILTDSSATPNPAELAKHLAGIINNSLLAFGGLAILGAMQIVASVLAPGEKAKSNTKQNAQE